MPKHTSRFEFMLYGVQLRLLDSIIWYVCVLNRNIQCGLNIRKKNPFCYFWTTIQKYIFFSLQLTNECDRQKRSTWFFFRLLIYSFLSFFLRINVNSFGLFWWQTAHSTTSLQTIKTTYVQRLQWNGWSQARYFIWNLIYVLRVRIAVAAIWWNSYRAMLCCIVLCCAELYLDGATWAAIE